MKTVLRLLVSLAVAAGLIALLMAWGGSDIRRIPATLGRLEGPLFWSAFCLQGVCYPLRALRFRLLLRDRPAFWRVLPVTASHILAANVLPAKLGEASVIVYLKRCAGTPAADGLAVLLLSRVLDLAVVAGCLSIACLTLGATGAFPTLDWLSTAGGALGLATVVLGWIALSSHHLVDFASRCVSFLRLDRTLLGTKLTGAADAVSTALRRVRRRDLVTALLPTVPIWISSFVFYAILARRFGLTQLRLDEAVFGSSLAVLANLLPVNGFAGLGTQETGWVVAFGALGVTRDLALETGLASHLVYLFNLAFFGALGHLAMALVPRPSATSEPTEPS